MSYSMKISITILLVLGMASTSLGHRRLSDYKPTIFNVLDFGAAGDGKKDDSQAFLRTWNAACETEGNYVNFVVEREKTFLLYPVRFEGPCKSSHIRFQILGNISAPKTGSSWTEWIVFHRIDGLTVDGGGTIDGQGSYWWKQLQPDNLYYPMDGRSSRTRPDALNLVHCNDFELSGLNHVNSPKRHVVVNGCNGGTISYLHIRAPQESPNTDGIGISHSTNIHLHHCNIGTGDDCVAIIGNSSNVNVSNVECGPGHGISVGSLGKDGEKDQVQKIHVRDCSFTETENGVRIKTWQGGSGYAREISFDGITLSATDNPIIIDQYYCDHTSCTNQTSAVKVSDVSFSRIHGTTTSKVAIDLSCSKSVGCTKIFIDNINITSANGLHNPYSNCLNAYGRSISSIPPVDCLLK